MQPDWMRQATAQAATMTAQTVPVVEGRTLHIDGDMLAYWAGGNEDTDVATSRRILSTKIEGMQYAAGADKVVVHLTARTSTKGDRFIIATQKPYQGHRKSGRKPRNWEYLREWMEGGINFPFRTKLWRNREADDGFAYVARLQGASAVIATKDKDMRMITGCWHMDWDDMGLVFVPHGTFALEHNGKLYGHKWFWQQMLQGDTADNIPGLPRYKMKPVGEATAKSMIASCESNAEAYQRVADAYELFYQDEWRERMLEQALLLWLRNDETAHVSNVLDVGLPIEVFATPLDDVVTRIKEAYAQAAAIQGS